ncbi:MAG TPA: hypothetical protein VG204_01225 [Terriglobia bacterium]|nr:hypothetical protein [Terriglobia bacterium]
MKSIKALSIICGLGLFASAAIFAQEPLPPPLAAAGGKTFFFSSIEERSSDKVVKGAPYSAQATTETTQTLADGNQIHHQTSTNVYRDGQGRTRREETLGDLGPWSASQSSPRQMIFINDPVADVGYILNPQDHTASKMTPRAGAGQMVVRKRIATGRELPPPLPPPDAGADVMYLQAPPPGDAPDVAVNDGTGAVTIRTRVVREGVKTGEPGTTEQLGTQTMEGVQVTGTRTTYTIPAGQIGNDQPIQTVTERWYSPALQTVVMSKRSDPRVGVTTYRLTNISLAEPSPDLFQVPADYTVKDGPALFEFREKTKPAANQ